MVYPYRRAVFRVNSRVLVEVYHPFMHLLNHWKTSIRIAGYIHIACPAPSRNPLDHGELDTPFLRYKCCKISFVKVELIG